MVNDSLGGITQFIVDETTGEITGYKTEVGADTVFPFSKYSKVTIDFFSQQLLGELKNFTKNNIDARNLSLLSFESVSASGSKTEGGYTYYATLYVKGYINYEDTTSTTIAYYQQGTFNNITIDISGYEKIDIQSGYTLGSTSIGTTIIKGIYAE